MPNVHLTPQMQAFAERLVARGLRQPERGRRAGMRRLMEERGAAAFHAIKAELDAGADESRGGGGLVPFTRGRWDPEAAE